MLSVLFFVLGGLGAFAAVAAIAVVVVIVVTLPYNINKKQIKWQVDLRAKLPPVTRQKGNSCTGHAAAAVLGFNGIKIDDPDKWYLENNFWSAWGEDNGLTPAGVWAMVGHKIGFNNFSNLDEKGIIPAIKAGKPVFIGINACMHVANAKSRRIPFSRQNLERGYKFFAYLNKYAKKPLLRGHAMVICGISADNQTLMLRDSAGADVGEGGYWAMPTTMLSAVLIPEFTWIMENSN